MKPVRQRSALEKQGKEEMRLCKGRPGSTRQQRKVTGRDTHVDGYMCNIMTCRTFQSAMNGANVGTTEVLNESGQGQRSTRTHAHGRRGLMPTDDD